MDACCPVHAACACVCFVCVSREARFASRLTLAFCKCHTTRWSSRQARCHPGAVSATAPVVRDQKKAAAMKEEGNRCFKAGDYEQAIDCYTSALDLCLFAEEHRYARSVYYGNRAQCWLSLLLSGEARYSKNGKPIRQHSRGHEEERATDGVRPRRVSL